MAGAYRASLGVKKFRAMREKSCPARWRITWLSALRSFYMPRHEMCGQRPHAIMSHCAVPLIGPVPESTLAEQRMALAIRDVREHDLDAVLALNNAAGRSILALDAAQLRYFYDHAEYFRVAEIDDHLAGFLIALREGGDYESPNYRWFAQHYPQFVYIDRIVIANAYHRHGLGRIFYCDVHSYAEVRVPLLTCEVFLEPRDDVV